MRLHREPCTCSQKFPLRQIDKVDALDCHAQCCTRCGQKCVRRTCPACSLGPFVVGGVRNKRTSITTTLTASLPSGAHGSREQ